MKYLCAIPAPILYLIPLIGLAIGLSVAPAESKGTFRPMTNEELTREIFGPQKGQITGTLQQGVRSNRSDINKLFNRVSHDWDCQTQLAKEVIALRKQLHDLIDALTPPSEKAPK